MEKSAHNIRENCLNIRIKTELGIREITERPKRDRYHKKRRKEVRMRKYKDKLQDDKTRSWIKMERNRKKQDEVTLL